MNGIPWDEKRLSLVEASAQACDDACSADAISLVAEVRRLQALVTKHPRGEGHTCAPLMYEPKRGYAYAVDCGCRL